jgi:glycosyltransferase involved in cell wall biosynthesis
MRQQLARRFRLNIGKIDVIPHGELGSLYRKLAHAAGLPPKPREAQTILFFGRIWPYKGLRYLLEAFAIVKQTLPDACLIIAGKGDDLEANQQRIDLLQDVEVLSDFVPPERVAGLFERSNVVVLPYVEASQSGVSAIGFTLGTVVVASRVGGLADSIQDRRTGVLVEPRNPVALAAELVSILKGSQEQQRIREQAQQAGENDMSWTRVAERVFHTYNKALARA